MDLNFHYYAVKTLAVRAGFAEEDAQVIANYSQFVDDFTNFFPMFFKDVPAFAQHLGIDFGLFWVFYPVTTGFDKWYDMARLALEKNQRNITVPYHFIPPHTKLNEEKKGDERIAWRVKPARMDSESLIQGLLLKAKDTFKDKPDAKENLIRIGALLHTFADTYAHQNFSGFWGWENYCTLTSVYDNVKKTDITSDYAPGEYHLFPAIGHTEANHAPDDSNVFFDAKMKFTEKGDYDFTFGRSNTSEYSIVAREIINYLSACLGKEPLSESDWNKLSEQLGKGFLTSQKTPTLLNAHWKKIFADVDYHYDKNEMMNELLEETPWTEGLPDESLKLMQQLSEQGIEMEPTLYKAKSDDFFYYNVIADKVRNFVNGKDVGEEQRMILVNALKL